MRTWEKTSNSLQLINGDPNKVGGGGKGREINKRVGRLFGT